VRKKERQRNGGEERGEKGRGERFYAKTARRQQGDSVEGQ
jgi:hypothetical protein